MFNSGYRLVRTAMHSLQRHVMRSLLTCLGIIIGIAAVIAVVEIGQGTSSAIGQAISSLGANVVQVDPSDAVKAGVSGGSGGRVTLTPADCAAILRECSAVRWAAPSLDLRAQVIYGNRNWSPNDIRGTTLDYLIIRNWPVVEGEAFTEADVATGARVCLLGQTVAKALFEGSSAIGKQVRIRNVAVTVIGVLGAKGANMMGRDQDDYVVAPWTTVKFGLGGLRKATTPADSVAAGGVNSLNGLYPTQSVTLYPPQSAVQLADQPLLRRFVDLDDIFVSANSAEEVPVAIAQITQLLRERHRIAEGEENDFRIRDLTEISESLASTGRIMTALLLCVAMISLIVGGVGIMNIMLASVTERTREIGVRMAVGARGKDILRQFLMEAVLLCLAGGVAGIMVGRGASMAVMSLLKIKTLPSASAVVIACAVSTAVGVVFGYYPAWRASRLDPIEAMRHE